MRSGSSISRFPWAVAAVAVLIALGAGIVGWNALKSEAGLGNADIPEVNVSLDPDSSGPVDIDLVPSHRVVLETEKGNIAIDLFEEAAPKTVQNFIKLVSEGYYDGIKFHRVEPGFVVQGGDPNSKNDDPGDDGMGGPGYDFEDEINPRSLGLSGAAIADLERQGYSYNYELRSLPVDPGYVAMANRGPNTNGSQFFIVTSAPQKHLYGKHTVFGKIAEGMDVVLKIEQYDRIIRATVE